jgi:hypothetical protein
MRLPAACNDAKLLEDEPFFSSFAKVSRAAEEQGRILRHKIATQGLREVPDGVRILFPRCSVFECSSFRF